MDFIKKIDKPMLIRYIALTVLIILVVGATIVTNLNAKYTNGANGSTDTARVTKWSVDVTDEGSEVGKTGEKIEKTTSTSEKAKYKFSATNQKNGSVNETLLSYDVTVTLSEALPEGVSMYINQDEGDAESTRIYKDDASSGPKEYTFKNKAPIKATPWQFSPGTSSSLPLYLFVTTDGTASTQTIEQIKIKVNYEQVLQ